MQKLNIKKNPIKKENRQNSLIYTLTITAKIHAWQMSIKVVFHLNTCVGMFVAAEFVILMKWKQCKSPSMDEWIIQLITPKEYHLAISKK